MGTLVAHSKLFGTLCVRLVLLPSKGLHIKTSNEPGRHPRCTKSRGKAMRGCPQATTARTMLLVQFENCDVIVSFESRFLKSTFYEFFVARGKDSMATTGRILTLSVLSRSLKSSAGRDSLGFSF